MIFSNGDKIMFDSYSRKSAKQSQRGTTTVEFSVIAVLLLVILFGIIEYAMIFLQQHYVANAAREAVRIGVRANNYNTYNGTTLPNATVTTPVYDREAVVKNAAADYLDVFYNATVVRNGTSLRTRDQDGNLATDKDRVLTVTVTVENLFSSITPGLLRILGSSSASGPEYIGYSASMELEDPAEFDPANL